MQVADAPVPPGPPDHTDAPPEAQHAYLRRVRAAGGLDIKSLRHMLSFLDPLTLCAASCVNVLWNGASAADDLWRLLALSYGFTTSERDRNQYRRFGCFSFKVRCEAFS